MSHKCLLKINLEKDQTPEVAVVQVVVLFHSENLAQ